MAPQLTSERPVTFKCNDSELIGIVTLPERPIETGLVIIVGGSQYRAGSHRQFTLLARSLAAEGIASLRFDYRGMGDSEGSMAPGVDGIGDDIRSAVDTFLREVPAVRSIALWGLCGAASAAALYAPDDPRVGFLAMLNPWVRTRAGLARAQIKHYYAARLRDPAAWRRLFSGEMNILASLRSAAGIVFTAMRGAARQDTGRTVSDERGAKLTEGPPLDGLIAESLRRFKGSTLLILSGDDLTANEFRDALAANPGLRGAVESARTRRHDLHAANHTFASREWRDQVARWTGDWLLGTD